MEVNRQLQAPAALPSHQVPIGLETEWTIQPNWTVWRREKSLAYAENQIPVKIGCVVF
jgi:hypothetical protein